MKKLVTFILILTNTLCFSQSFNTKRLDSLFQILEQNNKFMGSITISQNGKSLYTNSVGYADVESSKKATAQTKYRIGSISKMFTATLILKAVEEGKLSLDQNLDKYYPQIDNAKKITIRTMLKHSSGIHDFTHDAEYMTYNTSPKSEKQMIDIITKNKSAFEPGTKTEYCNSNYVVLSYILEKIYNKPYSSILQTKILKPLGLKNTYFGGKIQIANNESNSYKFTGKWVKSTETDSSIPMGAGAIVSNPADLTRFIEQLFAGKIISQASLSLMKTTTEFHGMGIGTGMLAFNNLGKKSYGHNGAIDDFQSYLSYLPEDKLAIGITSNGASYSINNVLLCALSAYLNKPFTLPIYTHVEIKPETMDLYLGEYSSKQLPIKITVTKTDNTLFAQATGQAAFPLEATAVNIFKFEQAGVVIEFDAPKKQLTLKQGGQVFTFTKE